MVVGAHKSVAVLGVVGGAEVMHSILDAETDATMAWLDTWFHETGGRRGRNQTRAETGGLVYARTRHGTSRAGDPAALLFTNEASGPIRRTRFSGVWRPAAQVAGLAPGTGFHALRHFYASLLIRHGESVKVVQNRLGHASAAETLDTYSHLWPDSEDRTRQAVDLVLGARVSPACHAEAT